jgi:hypothetical protein
MKRLAGTISLVFGLAVIFPPTTGAGSTNYEPTYPPRILSVGAHIRSFYIEIKARNEVGGFGHSYVSLGTIDESGHVRETVVAGFMPKSADDDRWARFGVPVTGHVGVVRSDFVRRPNVRLRIRIGKEGYFRAVDKIQSLRHNWKTYEVLVYNCNSFVSQIADVVGLRTPLVAAQFPVRYVTELRAINSR